MSALCSDPGGPPTWLGKGDEGGVGYRDGPEAWDSPNLQPGHKTSLKAWGFCLSIKELVDPK